MQGGECYNQQAECRDPQKLIAAAPCPFMGARDFNRTGEVNQMRREL